MVRIIRVLLFLLLTGGCAVNATGDDRLSVAPMGRLFVDAAALYSRQEPALRSGAAIPEIWLGARMDYGKWESRINVAFNQNQVNLRALYLGYNFTPRLHLRVGSFVSQFGLRTTLLSTIQASMISPMVNTAFIDGRQLAAMLVYYPHAMHATLSLHTAGETAAAMLGSKDYAREGFGFTSRLAWHPVCADGKVAQIGVSAGFTSPRKYADTEGGELYGAFTMKANYPTGVVQVKAVDATVTHATGKWKVSPELLLNYRFMALESQYYFSRITRRDGYHDYTAHGMYLILRGLLRGNSYSYAPYAGVLDNPSAGSLECVLDYNFTDLSDRSAGIMGGQANNLSLTFNYYINKYVTARLRAGYSHVWNSPGHSPVSLNAIMARIQVIF